MNSKRNAQRITGLAVAAVFVILILSFLALGRWQLQRMHEKQALFAAFESGDVITLPLSQVDPGTVARYQHVIATGHYDGERQILLDNMTHQGRAGYRVLTPLVGRDGAIVLVDRGWVPAGRERTELPDVSVPGNLRGVSGKLDLLPRAGIELDAPASNQDWPRVWSYPRLEDLERALGQQVFPWIILLDADQADGYVREWRPSVFPPERHLAYAVTWFALALTVAIAWAVVARKRGGARHD